MDAVSLLDNAKDAYVTGLSAQVSKKAAGKAAAIQGLPGDAISGAEEKKVRETLQEKTLDRESLRGQIAR